MLKSLAGFFLRVFVDYSSIFSMKTCFSSLTISSIQLVYIVTVGNTPYGKRHGS